MPHDNAILRTSGRIKVRQYRESKESCRWEEREKGEKERGRDTKRERQMRDACWESKKKEVDINMKSHYNEGIQIVEKANRHLTLALTLTCPKEHNSLSNISIIAVSTYNLIRVWPRM